MCLKNDKTSEQMNRYCLEIQGIFNWQGKSPTLSVSLMQILLRFSKPSRGEGTAWQNNPLSNKQCVIICLHCITCALKWLCHPQKVPCRLWPTAIQVSIFFRKGETGASFEALETAEKAISSLFILRICSPPLKERNAAEYCWLQEARKWMKFAITINLI